MKKTTQDTAPSKTHQGLVKAATDAASTLAALFSDSLKDIYWAENALLKALPKMRANASSKLLASLIDDHLAVTEKQLTRLDDVFKSIGERAAGKKCEAMDGLLKEADGILEETAAGPVRDAGIVAACQKVEHYEIATYGTLVAFAKKLGNVDAARLLSQTLAEEKEADMLLTNVALSEINADANEE